MSGFSTEAKVGVFVIIGLAILAYMTIQLGVLQLGSSDGYKVYMFTDNAGGLKRKAPVLMAGIQIGSVESIDLVDNRARLTLVIDSDIKLPQDSVVSLSTSGILGDAYVKIAPGYQTPLEEEGELVRVQASAKLEDLGDSMAAVLEDLKVITGSLKLSLASAESQENIQTSLANIREITDALKLVIAGNEQRMVNVVHNLEEFTNRLNLLVAKIDSGQGTVGALVNERQTVDDLNATLASLKSVSQKIDEGEGSLGKLVNDDQTVTRLDDALGGINDYITRADKWRLGIDYRGEWNFREEAMRNTLNVRLQPTADKFFLVGVVDDPRGYREDSYQKTVETVNGLKTVTETRTTHVDDDKLGFNVQFGKRFYDLTLRGGLFNSTGGVALDYALLNDDIILSFEASDFRADENPRLRLSADYRFWKYFFVTAGWDDMISNYGQDNFFLGGGITFYDDDLKFLFSSTPVP